MLALPRAASLAHGTAQRNRRRLVRSAAGVQKTYLWRWREQDEVLFLDRSDRLDCSKTSENLFRTQTSQDMHFCPRATEASGPAIGLDSEQLQQDYTRST